MSNIQKLNYPDFEIKIKEQNGKEFVFDEIRKKYILLTPEEWVRQNTIKYFTEVLGYPSSIIGIEKQIKVFNTTKRPDIIIFGKLLEPKIIIECKEPKIIITNETLKQSINYFLELKAPYIMLTNGISHFFIKIENKTAKQVNEIPKYEDL